MCFDSVVIPTDSRPLFIFTHWNSTILRYCLLNHFELLRRSADGSRWIAVARCSVQGVAPRKGIASPRDNTDDWVLRRPSELARDLHFDSSRRCEEPSFSWILGNSSCPPLIFPARRRAPQDDCAMLAQVCAGLKRAARACSSKSCFSFVALLCKAH